MRRIRYITPDTHHQYTIVHFIDQTTLSLQVVREHYRHFASHDQKATLRVSFESSEISLDIPVPDGPVTGEGWRITPFAAPTVS